MARPERNSTGRSHAANGPPLGSGGYDGEPGTFYDGDKPSILIVPGLVITVY